jgi:predicted metal-dependent hydrolase
MTVTKYMFKFDGETIEYSVHRSKRVRTSEIIVDEDSVMVRTPMDKPMSEIESIVGRKKNWIVKKQNEYRKREYHITKPTFEVDSTLPYLGKNIPVKISANLATSNSIKLVDAEFRVSISGKASAAQIRKLYEEWLFRTAHKTFAHKVRQYSRLLNVEIKKVTIKNLKGRWGAITKVGGINLNANLIKAPEDAVDYIIIHELCHFIIKGHSHHFWELRYQSTKQYQIVLNSRYALSVEFKSP